jgi:hypothetical protein
MNRIMGNIECDSPQFAGYKALAVIIIVVYIVLGPLWLFCCKHPSTTASSFSALISLFVVACAADLIYQHYRGRLFIKRRPASPSNGDGLDPLQQPELVPDQAASAAAASTALATATAASAAASATEFRMNKDRAYSVARTAAKALRGGDASSDAMLELNPEFQKRFGLVYEQYRPSLFWCALN